jgi:hypothetical protein
MAITGERFLELSRADHLDVSGHALRRLRSRGGAALSGDEALELFRQARLIPPDDLFLLGYRPAYGRHLRRGRKLWYFRMAVRCREMIALAGQVAEGDLAWVTTYGRDAQTDLLRVTQCGEVVGVA